jgi:hypothetical protein
MVGPPGTEARAAIRRVWHTSSRWLPQGWIDALRQLALFAAAYYAYRLVRGFVDGRAVVAFENARALVDIERALGTFFEPGSRPGPSARNGSSPWPTGCT